MPDPAATNGAFSVRAHVGDLKTLLAFDITDPAKTVNLAGFTIEVKAGTLAPYYLLNELQFEKPADHAQNPTLPPNSSFNAPIHKFRWLHVPGSAHQGIDPVTGAYTYTATPRYFDGHESLLPIDASLAASVTVQVGPFAKGALQVGFTRGFTQSQAFVRHFGLKALVRPPGHTMLYDTSALAGTNADGQQFTYRDEYTWLGFTARQKVFALLDAVVADPSLFLDVFAYDLNEPDLIPILLTLAAQGRVRVILDNASLHHASPAPPADPPEEDQFETLFTAAATGHAAILRGRFSRYAHDKVFIVKSGEAPASAVRVLTGSTNFAITGLYVNANHVLVFDDASVAAKYAEVFDTAWTTGVKGPAFRASPLSAQPFPFSSTEVPAFEVTFAPHTDAEAAAVLNGIAARIAAETTVGSTIGSVLFAVMDITAGNSPVYDALKALHASQSVFSYGISDNPGGISLYRPGSKHGVLVTGKPADTVLPPPFSQVPNIGAAHQVHHKFVVCGFRGPDPVVYCGSSNLALGGEEENGDNLLAIHDADVATAFTIEALALVDHFDFLDRAASNSAPKPASDASADATSAPPAPPPASKTQAAVDAAWFLSTTDRWVKPYYDPADLHCIDRQLFA
jgi:hypothetical protein